MRDFSEYKSAFDRQGFVIVPAFLDKTDLRHLTDELDRYISQVVPGLPETHAFFHDRARPETLKQMQHMQGDEFFAGYTKNSTWESLAQTLVGEEAHCETPEWFNKPPNVDHPTPPHQDNYYFNLKPPNVVTIWLALDRVDAENGCLRYLPGSHLKGFRPHARSNVLGFSQGIIDYSDADRSAEIEIHLQPGDAVAHHGMTAHRAEPNRTSTRNRRSFAMVYKGVSCQKDLEGFARYEEDLKRQHATLGVKTS